MGASPDTSPQATMPGRRQRGLCIKSGVGGTLEGHPLGCAPQLAEDRRPPLCGQGPPRPPHGPAQEHPRIHAQHPGPSAWFCAIFLGVLTDLRLTELHGPLQEEVASGRSLGAGLCLRLSWLSHCLLSLRERLSDFLQTELFRGCSRDRGSLVPFAPTVTAHLPLRRLCPGHLRPHVPQGAGVPLLNTGR